MKKYKINFLFLIMFFISCSEDYLDLISPNELSEKIFWQSENDADLALAGAYKDWETYTNIVFLDAATDIGYEQFNYGYQPIANGQISASNYSQGFWADSEATSWFKYSRIRKYNDFLTNIVNVDMDESKMSRYIAEVRFLRAYDYFNKVMFFGDIPLVTELIPFDENPARESEEKVKAFILDELESVSEILPVQNNIESKGHITKGAALALKARLELYMGRYEDALKDSKAVIDMGVYELFPDYRRLFLPESEAANAEAILEVEYISDNYANMLPQLNLPPGDFGWSALEATKAMLDTYETDEGKLISDPTSNYNPDKPFAHRDPRLEMTIIYPGQFWNGRYFNPLDQRLENGTANIDYYLAEDAAVLGTTVKKYVEPGNIQYINNYDSNIMVIRLAEVYLIFAEAAIETGQNQTLALELINQIRNRSGQISASVLTKELIKRERIVELAYEGLRYFDLKRWDLGPQLLDGVTILGTRKGSVDANTGVVSWNNEYIRGETRSYTAERKYLLPIPQSEMDANPNMVQNPGY